MKDIFNSHPVSVLKKEISKTNVKGYSKLKKAEVVELMIKNKDRFSHIKMAVKKERKSQAKQVKAKPVEPKKKEEPEKKEEPKKEKPKKKEPKAPKAPKAPKKEKPKFMILREEIDELLKQLKKSYEKNKPKLDKMTPLKYKNTIKRQNDKFLDEVKDIYNSLQFNVDMEVIKENDKRFFEIIPREKLKKKEEPKKKADKPKPKKERSEKQKANDKRLGELAKQRASKKKEAVAEPGMPPSV